MTYKPETVLITGATGDFGKAFAKRFAEIGSNLILHGRNAEKLETLAKSLNVPCHICAFDMSDKVAMAANLDALPNEFKNIDLLINNAGLALGQEAAFNANPDDWDTMIDINTKALARMTNLILKGWSSAWSCLSCGTSDFGRLATGSKIGRR